MTGPRGSFARRHDRNEPGERRAPFWREVAGFGPGAYTYGAVLMRREVRELEMKSHMELVERVKAQEVTLKLCRKQTMTRKTLS